MQMHLSEFKKEFLECILRFLWNQWSSIGVAGYGEIDRPWVVDPEALIALTGTFGRYDPRLFDEMLDWLDRNERFINVQRLRNILKTEGFASSYVIGELAAKQLKDKKGIKWKGLYKDYLREENPQALFLLKSGKAFPVVGEKDPEYLKYGYIRNPVVNRGLSRPFPPKTRASLHLQLRALFGLNSRSEILLYLILKGSGTIRDMADQSYYAWRSIQDTLLELSHSALLQSPEVKKGRVYYFDSTPWKKLLLKQEDAKITWICWASLFRVIEMVWQKLMENGFCESDKLVQAAELNELMTNLLQGRLIKAGFGTSFFDLEGFWGKDYMDHWLEGFYKLLYYLSPVA
jgi:hypothetical protein